MLKWAVSGGSGGKGASTTCTRATPSCHLVPQSTTNEVNNNDDVNCGQLPPLPRHHHVKRHNIADTVDGKCQFIKGSDPLYQTARGKLQSRRSRLNDHINRELRLRSGAENLLNCTKCIPMIPLGLKETKDVSFLSAFKKFISEHYFENGDVYQNSVESIEAIRQACRTPVRTDEGVELLFRYYNHLYFVERRFFAPQINLGIYFEWYDSLTGVPSCQKTIGFEKGSILFNVGALYTQTGARQDRSNAEGLQKAVDSFQKSAGAFKYLREHFTHAPSKDMQKPTLDMLIVLMTAQSQECLFELRLLQGINSDMVTHFSIAHEAAVVCDLYKQTEIKVLVEAVNQHIPAPWVALIQSKALYYRGLSHFHSAIAVLDQDDSDDVEKLREHFDDLHIWNPNRKFEQSVASKVPKSPEERKLFAKAHLHQAILANEDALRIHNQSRQLRKIDTFHEILRKSHDRSLLKFSTLEEEDDFTELVPAPAVHPKAQTISTPTMPDFSMYKVEDLFFNLGPAAIFCAQHSWTAPRIVEVRKSEGQEFGFSIRGDSPVIVAAVDRSSLAEKSGMKVGDFIIGVHETDARWFKHEETVALIRQSEFSSRNARNGTEIPRHRIRERDPTPKTSKVQLWIKLFRIGWFSVVVEKKKEQLEREKSGSAQDSDVVLFVGQRSVVYDAMPRNRVTVVICLWYPEFAGGHFFYLTADGRNKGGPPAKFRFLSELPVDAFHELSVAVSDNKLAYIYDSEPIIDASKLTPPHELSGTGRSMIDRRSLSIR
ncbi:hypothetical protein LSH36_37g16032 [Paralvinella palmiformis]|uniref:Rhophilin-2 n=1 Tax=Paralvinella palmiformis TaxID=53620 RepID=A0AAD9K908_9ANNE|nr:hypothetical protein LSH36_37g16032 [Paralvinella palmiformis]